MRKFMKLALEGGMYGGVELSLEEEQSMLVDSTADAAAVATELNEAERVIEVSDALEDLAVVADDIAEATPVEARLIDTTAAMAVAGTDVEAEEMVPAMESFIGKRIATEGIRETARVIWENIIRHLKKVWEKIESFFHKYFGTLPGLKRQIEALTRKVDAASGLTNSEKKITLTSGIASISVDGTPVKDEGKLHSELGVFTKVVKTVFGGNLDEGIKAGETITAVLNDFDPKTAEAQCTKFVLDVRKQIGLDVLSGFGSGSTSTTRFPGFNAKFSAPFFGNKSLVAKLPVDKELSILGAMEYTRRSGVSLEDTKDKAPTIPDSIEFATLSVSGMNKVLDECRTIVDLVESYQRSKGFKEIKAVKAKMQTASEKAAKAQDAASGSDDPGVKAAVPFYRSLVNFNSAYARWTSNPSIPLAQQATATVRTAMVLVQKSLAGYK